MFDVHKRKLASEKFVEFDLLSKDIMVLKPVSDIVENYDLIAEHNGNLIKVQVKSAVDVDGRMVIDVRRSSKAKSRHYEEGAYDVLAIVNVEKREVCYILQREMTAKSSINVWTCDRSEIPSKGIHKHYVPFVFNEHLEFPL